MNTDPRMLELENGLRALGTSITYPPTPDPKPAVFAVVDSRAEGRSSTQVRRLRLVLVVLLAAIILVATVVVAADPLGWFRQTAAVRGPQFTGEYALTELWRADPSAGGGGHVQREHLAVDPAGEELYLIEFVADEFEPGAPRTLLRIETDGSGIDSPVDLAPLTDPSLWAEAIDPEALVGLIGPVVPLGDGKLLALAGAWAGDELDRAFYRPPEEPAATSLVERDSDGRWTRILSFADLEAEGSMEPKLLQQWGVTLLAGSADRLWLLIVSAGPDDQVFEGQVTRHLWEVRDPDGDGDWSDREVTAMTLPDWMARETRTDCCMEELTVVTIGAEDQFVYIHRQGIDSSRRLIGYRLAADEDRIEAEPFFDEEIPDPLAAEEQDVFHTDAIGYQDGTIELAVSGWSGPSRISRLAAPDEVTDIGRGFGDIRDLATDRDGRVYLLRDGVSIQTLRPVIGNE